MILKARYERGNLKTSATNLVETWLQWPPGELQKDSSPLAPHQFLNKQVPGANPLSFGRRKKERRKGHTDQRRGTQVIQAQKLSAIANLVILDG